MKALITFIKQELYGWRTSEYIFFLVSCLTIFILSLYSGDTILGLISSISGVAYTLCNGKGKRIAYIFGLINSALFAIIAFQNTIYGDAVLYGIYYVPAMFFGFFAWSKHQDNKRHEVIKQRMNIKQRLILIAVCVIGVCAGGFILSMTNDALPFVDSFTTVIQIIATILAIRRYIEQWVLWTAANAVEVVLWGIRTFQGAENATVSLIMFISFLIIGIKMWIDWTKTTPNSLNS